MSHQDPILEYQRAIPTSRWAISVFCASLVAAGAFFLIVPALLILLIAIFVRSSLAHRTDVAGQGLASAAVKISAVAAFVGVAVLVLLPGGGGSRELSNRSHCAANLRGITQSMNVYAPDGDWFPIVGPTYSSTLAAALPGTPAPPTTLLSNKLGGLYAPPTPPGNVTQNLWLLVLTNQVAPKQFICKSDPWAVAPAPSVPPGGTDYYANFHAAPSAGDPDLTYSYSFAFPWTAAGKIGEWWHNDQDASLPLIADIAPANGTGPRGAPANTLDGSKKTANSMNHERDGQNVGYADGHAEFARTANCGQSNDNIYSANAAAGPSPFGLTPSSATHPRIAGGSKGNWDIILVPAADAATGVRN